MHMWKGRKIGLVISVFVLAFGILTMLVEVWFESEPIDAIAGGVISQIFGFVVFLVTGFVFFVIGLVFTLFFIRKWWQA